MLKLEENQDGPNRSSRFRIVDEARKVRTPWLHGSAMDSSNARTVTAARLAVERADPSRPGVNTSRDGEWLIVHSL